MSRVAELAPVVIWMSDLDQRCTYVNAAWMAFTGLTLEAALADGWRQTVHAERLKQSELTEAQRLAGIGSWQWDSNMNEVVWSDELYRIAGLEPRSSAAAAGNHPHL